MKNSIQPNITAVKLNGIRYMRRLPEPQLLTAEPGF